MTGRRVWPAALIVAVASFVISLGRLWLGNHEALTQVVWAEDGLFPLCVRKAGFLTCLVDPFAGYLLALPRLIAGGIAFLPPSTWALATNLVAGVLAALAGAAGYAIVRRSGGGAVVSVLIGLLPVIVPVVGLEAINALGSSYMLLLYVGTLLVVFPRWDDVRWPATIFVALFLLLTSLTIPTAVIIAGLVVLQALRGHIRWRTALVWVVAVGLGLIAQWWTAVHAAIPRAMHPSADTVRGWVDGIPSTLLTYVPGLELHDYTFATVFPITVSGWIGPLCALALLVGGIVSVVRGWWGSDRLVTVGLLLLSGLAFGAVPAIIGGANNRYFVVPLLLWAAALLVALDPWIQRTRIWVLVLIAAIVVLLWWPLIPASWYRTKPAPPWADEVARIHNSCIADPAKKERIIFSPYWPPNWGDGLSEPTHPNLSCLVGRKF